MKHTLYHIWIWCSLLFIGCETVYEYPEGKGVDPTVVKFRLTVAVDFRQAYDYVQTVTRSDNTQATPRLVIEAYVDDNPNSPDMSSKLYESEPYCRKVLPVTATEAGQQRIQVDLELSPRPYLFIVWADYADGSSLDNLHYDTRRLYAVGYTDSYQGNTAMRDAFWASRKIDLSPYEGEWFTEIEEEIVLTRPLARYEIITQDLDRFADLIAKNTGMETVSHTDVWEELQKYKVIIRHAGFCPTEFDAATGRLTDAMPGMSFEGTFTQMDETSALLAFDYIMAGKDESAITIDLEIYDGTGALMQQIPAIRIPFKRNVITRVFGNLLTAKYEPSIGIDPEYDGEFNIYL